MIFNFNEKTKLMKQINKHLYKDIRNSAMGSQLRRKGKFWFPEAYELLRLSNYKVKIIKGIEKNKFKYAITPTKIAPDFWLFSYNTKEDAIKFIEKMNWRLIKN